jgi:hypothetical protein
MNLTVSEPKTPSQSQRRSRLFLWRKLGYAVGEFGTDIASNTISDLRKHSRDRRPDPSAGVFTHLSPFFLGT